MSPDRPAAPDGLAEPDLRLPRLREAATLIARIAGCDLRFSSASERLAADAHIAIRLADLPPVARRRYEALAGETGALAHAGLALLVERPTGPGVAAAAARLAEDIRAGIARMDATLG